MRDKFFLDTNIFAYAFPSFDKLAPKKRDRAIELVEKALFGKQGCVSFQVIQELISCVHRQLDEKPSAKEFRIYIQHLMEPICEVFPSIDFYYEALKIQEETRHNIYDAMILGAALQANCSTIYSEDFQDGFKYKGLTIKNPF
jgi:predicted nucleic acid-binding protein